MLVVDDEAEIRDSLRDVLEDEGYRVRMAANGREALAELCTIPRPCAIILDIIMPVMSGTEFYEAMKADPRLADVPLLISTSDPTRAPPRAADHEEAHRREAAACRAVLWPDVFIITDSGTPRRRPLV
ncbi:MAG: response regulator, partial [Myxococcales bacterium]